MYDENIDRSKGTSIAYISTVEPKTLSIAVFDESSGKLEQHLSDLDDTHFLENVHILNNESIKAVVLNIFDYEPPSEHNAPPDVTTFYRRLVVNFINYQNVDQN